MFPVVFWILCSWLPCLANWQVSCSSTWSSCSKTSVNTSDRALSSRRGPEGAIRTFRGEMNIVSQIGRYFAWQHLVIGISSWQSWIQLVVWPATNEVDAISVWCVRDVWLLWSALPQHSAPTVLAAWVCWSLRTAESCSNPGDMKWTPGLVSLYFVAFAGSDRQSGCSCFKW